MSGIEVVGIVLGSIPLVISGLEHYAEGVRTIRRIMQHSREFAELAHKIRAESTVFRNTLEILLGDCVDLGFQQRRDLLADVSGEQWEYEVHQTALRQRLQKSYEVYVEYVTDRTFDGSTMIVKRVPFSKNDSGSVRQAYRKFRFALDDTEYTRLIKDIHENNSLLRTLTQQTEVLNRKQHTRSSLIPDFDQIRTNAKSIFQSLQYSLHVSCKNPHKASIYLHDHPPATIRTPAGRVSRKAARNDNNFYIVLHHDAKGLPSKQKALLWSIEEAEIRLLKEASARIAPGVDVAKATKEFEKGVRFQITTPQDQEDHLEEQVAADLEKIQDLCARIGKVRDAQSNCELCLGYLNSAATSHRHGLYWPQKRLMEQPALAMNNLDMILGQSKQGYRLTGAAARKMAVALASGVLRLHDTDWLPDAWSKRDIMVISDGTKVLGEHVFLSRAFETHPVDEEPGEMTPIRNKTLFALGILLIELCMGQTIEQLHPPEYLNPDGTKKEYSDYYTAVRLLKLDEIQDQFGQTWNDVVDRCIHCNLGLSKTSLEDAKFRKAVYDLILTELEEDARQFCGL